VPYGALAGTVPKLRCGGGNARADLSSWPVLRCLLSLLFADRAAATARTHSGSASAACAEAGTEAHGAGQPVLGFGIWPSRWRFLPRHPGGQSRAQCAATGSVGAAPRTMVSWAAVETEFESCKSESKKEHIMTTKIETALGEIKLYAHREQELLHQKSEKQIELQDAQRLGGEALLDGDTTDDAIDTVRRLQLQLWQIESALCGCRQRRLAAIAEKVTAEVAGLRQRASEARQQAEAIQAKTAPLLASLKELEGVPHAPQGVSHSANAASLAGIFDGQAGEIERRGVPRHGHIEIDSAIFSMDEIVDAVLQQSVDGPSASDVISWVDAQPKSATFAGNPTTCRLSWDMTAGGILPAAYIRTLPQPRAVAPPEEAPVPTGGRLVSVDQFFGHAARPRRDQREEQSA